MAGVKGRSGGASAKTVKEHRLQGTYQPVRHAGIRNPDPPEGEPDPPADLAGEALDQWHRMIARLKLCGTLSQVDDEALAKYCRLHARAMKLEAALAGEPVFLDKVTVDGSGQEHVERKVHPAFGQLRQYDAVFRQWLVEFGLTPASRGRVKLPEKKEQEDPFARFAAGGQH